MSQLQEQLDILDEQLESYEPGARWVIYILGPFGILLMSWMFFVSEGLDELHALQDQNSQLVAKIADSSPQAYQAKIIQTNHRILEEEKRSASLEVDKQDLLIHMSQSQGLIFDNRRYAAMLDLILKRSVQLGLKIELMQSEDADQVFFGKVKLFKKLSIKGSGNFRSIAAFLSYIEEQKMLIQIENVQIRSDEEKPAFEAEILFMGVAL